MFQVLYSFIHKTKYKSPGSLRWPKDSSLLVLFKKFNTKSLTKSLTPKNWLGLIQCFGFRTNLRSAGKFGCQRFVLISLCRRGRQRSQVWGIWVSKIPYLKNLKTSDSVLELVNRGFSSLMISGFSFARLRSSWMSAGR